ncbi:hypothetical protein AOB60_10180 [Streptomyces noursei]|uniref:Uncharacterized protein n=1 Tax=Streptomyces noursei TaxID=1971 RepID=A0A2N8PJC1_STRNR|nr:hypothetical protein AOB60_10180 [Streptomyces noursei]
MEKLYRAVTLVGPETVSVAASAICDQLDDHLQTLTRNIASQADTSSWEQEDAILWTAREAMFGMYTVAARSYWERPPA